MLPSRPVDDPGRPGTRALTEPAVDTLGRVWPAGTEFEPVAPPAPETLPSRARYESARIAGELVHFATVDLSPEAAARVAELVEHSPARDRLHNALTDLGERARALAPEHKRVVVERLLAAWLRAPELRLGQLIDNAVVRTRPLDGRLFDVEDAELVALIEAFVAEHGR